MSPAPRTRKSPSLILIAGVIGIVAVAGLMLNRFYSDPNFLPPDDFLQYWAAGRLQATGGNPYDADQLLPLQQAAGRPREKPAVVMWNPPWSLTLAMPFGLLPPRTAQLLWLGLQVLAIVVCADRLWVSYGGPPRYRIGIGVAALAFYPVMYILFAGQSGGWLLLGMTGLLLATTRGPVWLAVLVPLLALKPHLFVPVWVVLALEATRSRRGLSVFLWGLGSGLAAMAIPTLINPEVWSQYFAALNRPADATHVPLSAWRSPLAGWWLRMAVAPEHFWIQAIPTVMVLVAVPVYWWKRLSWSAAVPAARGGGARGPGWDWSTQLPWLILLGLIAAPYGAWPYDQVVLMVPVTAALSHLARHASRLQFILAASALVLIDVAAFTIREGEYFVWVPPAVLAWYAWAMAATTRSVIRPTAPAIVEEDRLATSTR